MQLIVLELKANNARLPENFSAALHIYSRSLRYVQKSFFNIGVIRIEKETVFTLMAKVIESETLSPDQKLKLLDEIRKARPALEDRWIYRWVVYFLGGTLSLSVLAMLYWKQTGSDKN